MKKTLSLLLAVCVTLTLAVHTLSPQACADIIIHLDPTYPVVEPDFPDVPLTHWAYNEIKIMTLLGVIKGMDDGNFDPNGELTFAQFASMLVRLFYADDLEAAKENNPDPEYWWIPEITVANRRNLFWRTTADDNCKFDVWYPEKLSGVVRRYDAAQIIYNYMTATENWITDEEFNAFGNVKAAIADFDLMPPGYQRAVTSVYIRGYMQGVDEKGTFSGDTVLTRAQAATLLCRVWQKEYPGASLPFEPDVTVLMNSWPNIKYVTAPATGYLTNGKPISEENIKEIFEELREEYPDEAEWNDMGKYAYSASTMLITGYGLQGGCGAFAWMITDRIFGCNENINPIRKVDNYWDMKVGDIAEFHDEKGNVKHYAVVIDINEEYFTTWDGNSSDKLAWGIQRFHSQFADTTTFYTRY